MSWSELVLIGLAGVGAGLMNTVVASGTLITFPTLLALGIPPVLANVSNTVGLVPGSVSGALATRPELSGQRSRLWRLGAASLLGGVVGALLLLRLPSAAFDAVVPVLIGLGCVLVVVQPTLSRRLAARRARLSSSAGPPRVSAPLWVGVMLACVYGGYFGAAQGVLLIAIMGIGLAETLPRVNAVKNVLTLIGNGSAAAVFVVVSDVDWWVAGSISVGSMVGAQIGGPVGRKLPLVAYRVVVVAVGLVAIINLRR